MIENFINLIKISPLVTDTYINHCVNVYNILKEEGNSEDVCNAGLYHSVYGTSYANLTLQTVDKDREIIKKEIGKYAENLVYEMCILPDRDNTILNGNVTWNHNVFLDIVKICRANLVELQRSGENTNIIQFNIQRYHVLLTHLLNGRNPFTDIKFFENKIKVFDNIFPAHYLDKLYSYVKNSKYSCGHISNINGKEPSETTRFVCHLTGADFFGSGLFPYIKKISEKLEQDLFLNHYYIGYYDKATSSDSHVDSSYENMISIVIYPNTYWEDNWAGDIKFYSENTPYHKTVDFSPGRIIVFDSRIKHKVLPVSSSSKSGRFSIILKASFFSGLSNLYNQFGGNTENIIHIPCF